MTIPVPGSNIRRYYSPSGGYLGFDNYGGDHRPVGGQPVQIPQMQQPSETEMLQRQYQTPPTTQGFLDEMRGTLPVGFGANPMGSVEPSDGMNEQVRAYQSQQSPRPLIKDVRWLKWRQADKQAADNFYQSKYGAFPEEDAYADAQGYTQFAQLRGVQQRPQQMDADRKLLAGIESQYGINAGLLFSPLQRNGEKNFRGWDQDANVAWTPVTGYGGEVTHSNPTYVDPNVRRAAMMAHQRLYGGGAGQVPIQQQGAQPTTQMPQTLSPEARRSRYEELQRKRNAMDPATAQSVLRGDDGSWGAFSGAMY